MFGKLSVALLLVAAPAAAQDAAQAPPEPAVEAEAPVAYKTKKICRSIEVVGSSIPRRACSTKRIPIKPVEEAAEPGAGQIKQAQAPKGE
jgi:hypothetical protein